ncbi:MAG: glycerate kinase, partial [Planctomycetaceae bacterium]
MDSLEHAHSSLTSDALRIWKAAVAAVDSTRLVRDAIRIDDHRLHIANEEIDLARIGRLIVVGAGKAGAGMALGFESALGDRLTDEKATGWMNVPADCVRPLRRIYLHAARPAGLNEPTAAGVEGADRILELVSQAHTNDVVIVLLSGGGSALLPSPKDGITLADKQQVTRLLMQRGATIHELNTVRKHLSQVKGGSLARACRAGLMIGLIISDVIGDPLDVIASGPTVPDTSTSEQAWEILQRFVPSTDEIPEHVRTYFETVVKQGNSASKPNDSTSPLGITNRVVNIVLGNNATALLAAETAAHGLGYRVINQGSNLQGVARQVGVELADQCCKLREQREPNSLPICLLSGGEPVVHLSPTTLPRKGGRNQELILAALDRLWETGCEGMVLLSGGTDGEDGPTDAAGAYLDHDIWKIAHDRNLHPHDYLAINDAYHYFKQ